MLVHQAALGFEAMTGHPAPLEAMRAAATTPDEVIRRCRSMIAVRVPTT